MPSIFENQKTLYRTGEPLRIFPYSLVKRLENFSLRKDPNSNLLSENHVVAAKENQFVHTASDSPVKDSRVKRTQDEYQANDFFEVESSVGSEKRIFQEPTVKLVRKEPSFKSPGMISRRTVTLKRDNSTATDYYYQNAGDVTLHRPIKVSSPVHTQTPIYQIPPPPPQPLPIIKNPVIRKLQEETLPSLSITSSIEQDSVLGMDRRPEKEDLIAVCTALVSKIRLADNEVVDNESVDYEKDRILDDRNGLVLDKSRRVEIVENGKNLLSEADEEIAKLMPELDPSETQQFDKLRLEKVVKHAKIKAAEDEREDLEEQINSLRTDLRLARSNTKIYTEKERDLKGLYTSKRTELSTLPRISASELDENRIRMNTTEERDQFIEEIKHQNRVLQSEKGRLSAAKRTYKGAQDKQKEINQIYYEEELKKQEQIQELKRQIQKQRNNINEKLNPDRLNKINDELELIKTDFAKREASRRIHIQNLDDDIKKAENIEINAENYIAAQNELHNLNLKCAKLETEKREIKWKCHLLKKKVAQIESGDIDVTPEDKRVISRARSIKDPTPAASRNNMRSALSKDININ